MIWLSLPPSFPPWAVVSENGDHPLFGVPRLRREFSRRRRDEPRRAGLVAWYVRVVPPSFVPRDFLTDPARFGSDGASWQSASTPAEATQIAAAYLQHRAARAVWERFDEDEETVAVLAARIGTTEDTLWRKLAGYVPASLTDMVAWAFAYDASVLPELSSLDDLLPSVPKSRPHRWRFPSSTRAGSPGRPRRR